MLAHVLAAAALALPASQAQQQLSIRPFAQGLSALTAVASGAARAKLEQFAAVTHKLKAA